MIRIGIISLLFFPCYSGAYTFQDVVREIQDHAKVSALMEKAGAMREQGQVRGSWGDPMLMVAAKNYPADNFRSDVDPMTSIEFGVSQKFPLTNKFSLYKKSQQYLGNAVENEAIHQQRALMQMLWGLSIKKKKVLADLDIFKENLSWITNVLNVTKRLYANGKSSQQSVLELQVRKAEIEAEISNKNYELQQFDEAMTYLYGKKGETLDLDSIPWKILTGPHSENESGDFRQQALTEALKASETKLQAQKLSLIPDLTLTASYMKRDYMGMGDMVSLGFTFPLPLSSKEHASIRISVNEKTQTQKELHDYKWLRRTELAGLKHQIEKIKSEQKILNQQTIQFARQSREITAKAYGLGNSSYVELIQSELKLQNLLLRKNDLESQLSTKLVEYKSLNGEELYAN